MPKDINFFLGHVIYFDTYRYFFSALSCSSTHMKFIIVSTNCFRQRKLNHSLEVIAAFSTIDGSKKYRISTLKECKLNRIQNGMKYTATKSFQIGFQAKQRI